VEAGRGDGGFLPDFCSVGVTFSVVLIGELLALVVALVPLGSRDFWLEFAYVSLFVQWVGLTATGLLCLLRRPLGRLAAPWAAAAAGALVLAVTAAYSALVLWLLPATAPSLPLDPAARADLLPRNLAIAAIITGLALRYYYVRHEWQRNIELEARARYQALQARIRPHFLFNSMNTIASLTRSRPEVAERVVEDLAALFRVALTAEARTTTLGEELALARRYLAIEDLRLGPRLAVHWQVEGGLEAIPLPPLVLQPLVENAVYHGVEPALEGGWVAVAAARAGDTVTVRVENSLPAGAPERSREGNRMAQDNVRERLEAFFGGRCGFAAGPAEDGYRVEMHFPAGGSER
jgi:two-component system sensor histidine kinase AlgZ